MLSAAKGELVTSDHLEAVRERVVSIATRLQNVSALALLAADGPEPERGAQYLFDLLRDVTEQLAAPIRP